MNARESFLGLLLAEWTKLRSVRRWVITLVGAIALTVGLSLLAASGNRTDLNQHPNFVAGPNNEPVDDTFYFVHQPVTGDATITVRVGSLHPDPVREQVRTGDGSLTRLHDDSPYASAAAGLMIKDGTTPGSSYAAVMLTAAHGVRMQSDYATDRAGSASSATRWLRLVRSANTVTGYESADGTSWQKIATLTPIKLPATAEIGFYVAAPSIIYYQRGGGSSSGGERSTSATATFDSVQFGSATSWKGEQIGPTMLSKEGERGPEGEFREAGGTYTVSGSGMIGPKPPDDDMVEVALIGVIAGLVALLSVGVLFATSEYRRGMIRATFVATPRRGRVLAAKALVLAGTAYAVSLAGVVIAFVTALPTLREHGFAPPAFPTPSLTDAPVARALLLSAAFMTGVSVFGLAVGFLLRRSAPAITVTIVLVMFPVILGMVLPGTSPRWLMYTTLAGGLATQRAKPPTPLLAEPWAMIGPWAGIGVVAAYAALALGLAWWQLRRRDA